MNISTISSAGGAAPNEDLIVVVEHGDMTDILLLDGASSVADTDYIDAQAGDVVWFVTQFCAALKDVISEERSQHDSVALALEALNKTFAATSAGVAIPTYAWPIAALTWLRIARAGAAATLHAYCVGDCKAFVRAPDGSVIDIDPYVNPQEQVLQAEMARLRALGVHDAAASKAALLPMLRARRAAQNTAVAPTVLCVAPRGPLVAREYALELDPAATVIAMTDGFYRLVDTYRLHTIEDLATLCVRDGLPAAHARLRDYERQQRDTHGLSVKRADDAAAIVARLPL
jgi:hypothetical protein